MNWIPPSHADEDRMQGRDVYTAEDEKIGTVDQVLLPIDISTNPDRYLRISSGLLDTEEFYVPESAVQLVGDDRLVLEATKKEIKDRGWTQPPEGYRRS